MGAVLVELQPVAGPFVPGQEQFEAAIAAGLKVAPVHDRGRSLAAAAENGLGDVSRLPASLKVLLENMLRFEDGKTVTKDDIIAFRKWLDNKGKDDHEIAYRPARVLMQDFTGVPAVVDLAAMREARAARGQYETPECGAPESAAIELAENQATIMNALPQRPNERLVYRCAPAMESGDNQ